MSEKDPLRERGYTRYRPGLQRVDERPDRPVGVHSPSATEDFLSSEQGQAWRRNQTQGESHQEGQEQ